MRYTLICWLLSWIHLPVFSQSADSLIADYMDSYDMVGMSAVVICNDSVMFAGHYGLADRAREIPVTDSTYFRIASVSKVITAIGMMQLIENGTITPDINISEILGYSVVNPAHPDMVITPAMLLSHTSGLADGSRYDDFLGATYGNPAPPNIREILQEDGAYYAADTYLNVEPGSYFNYANLNYGIIATLIEKASGQRFDRYMRDHVLLPLGITGSYNIYDLPDINNVAVLYRKSGVFWEPQADDYGGELPDSVDLNDYLPGWNGLIFSPQGGLRITAQELSRLMQIFLHNGTLDDVTLLNSETVLQMETPQWTYSPGNGNNYNGLFRCWGLGLHLLTNTVNNDIIYSGSTLAGHPGEAYGLVSDMYYDKAVNWGLIFITNGIGYPYEPGVHSAFYIAEEDIFDILYEVALSGCIGETGMPSSTPQHAPHLFPNPVAEMLYVSDGQLTSASHYTIIDALGRICQQGAFCVASSAIQVANLPSGVYRVTVHQDTKPFIATFIKR